MANPFVGLDTYVREVEDPRDQQKWKVTLRPLTAGDEAAIQDKIMMRQSEQGEDSIAPMLGTSKLLTVVRAVVAWDLPEPPNEATISLLHRDIFNQIFEAVDMAGISENEAAEESAPDPLNGSKDVSKETLASVSATEPTKKSAS